MENFEAVERPKNLFARFFFDVIDLVGRAASLLIFFMMAILCYGVIMRYALQSPSIWVSELSGMVYAVYFLIGGSYAILRNDHVNVDIFRAKLSERAKALLDLFTWLLFYCMIGVIFWLGIDYAYSSAIRLEKSPTVWGPYIWPVKLFVPFAAVLMLVSAIFKTAEDVRKLISSK